MTANSGTSYAQSAVFVLGMAVQLKSKVYRFYDSGALYLTDLQQIASFLEVRLSIVKYRPPQSFSYRRNPEQSVWGWVTRCYKECVYEEVELRYDYQCVYRDFSEYDLLAQLQCIYYRAVAANQKSIADGNGAQGPYTIQTIEGLTRSIRRPVDSFRFVGIVPCVFDWEVFWIEDDTDFGSCGLDRFGIPNPGEPTLEPPAYDPSINSDPGVKPVQTPGELPTDSKKSNIPMSSPSNDFSPRNANPIPTGIGTWDLRYRSTSFPSQLLKSTWPGYYDSNYELRRVPDTNTGELWRLTSRISEEVNLGFFTSNYESIYDFYTKENFQLS